MTGQSLVLVEPSCVVVEQSCVVVEPSCVVIEPSSLVIGQSCVVTELPCVVVEQSSVVAEPSSMVIEQSVVLSRQVDQARLGSSSAACCSVLWCRPAWEILLGLGRATEFVAHGLHGQGWCEAVGAWGAFRPS
jgi:hypothetical protein